MRSDLGADAAEPPQRSAPGTATRVAASLREQIITGELPPRTRLKDAHLSRVHQVSRNTVREALRELERDGLVTSRPHAGSAVKVLTEADAHDIYRVRYTIEIAGVAGSTSADPEQLTRFPSFAAMAREAAAEGRWADVGTNSLRLHQAIVGLLGSPMLDAFFATIVAQLRLVFALAEDEAALQAQWIDRDEKLVDLLLSGRRGQAELELRQYLSDSEAQIIEVIRASGAALTLRKSPPR
jgi:DNA-binding GntR family transcriptional regulator